MEIHTIKEQLTIGQVLQHYSLQPNKNNMLRCPFHTDKTPSLQIYPKTNTFCCFSSNCTAGSGDVIDFIGLMEQLNKHEALLKAKALLGVTPMNGRPSSNEEVTLSHIALLTKFYDSSLQSINRNERAQNYAKERGLNWKQLNIGSIGEQVSASWNSTYLQQAAAIGLLKQNGTSSTTGGTKYKHHFKSSLVFPLVNAQGQVVSIYGRSITDKKHIYLSGERQGPNPWFVSSRTNKG